MFATTPLALAVESLGLRATMIGLSVFGPAIAAAVALLARDSPADAGLAPIEDVPAGESLSLDGVLASAKRILGERETWLISAIMFCTLGINITVLGAWAVPYVAQVCSLSVTGASAFALAGSLGLLVGPPSIGWLSDLTGRRTELIIVGVFVFVCAYRILAVVRLPLLAVGIVFFVASATGGASSLSYTVIKECHAAAASGVATGVVNSGAFLGAAVFPTVTGALLDSYWTGRDVAGARVYSSAGFDAVFGLAAGAGVVALGCAAWLYRRERSEATAERTTKAGLETDAETAPNG